MRTTTIEDELAGIRGRIARLHAFAETGLVADTARIHRHLDALHQEEASVRAGARRGNGEAEGKLGQLRTRLAVAENALVADVSEEWAAFAAAVEDELRSWDTYLERLQVTTAVEQRKTRELAEAAIAHVRTRRIAVYDVLTRARERVNGTWHQQRDQVGAARDDLERTADQLLADLN
jgi:hypothetical protein